MVINTRAGQLAMGVVVALVMMLGLLPAAPAVGAQQSQRAASEDLAQPIRWMPCHEDVADETGAAFECARIRVPLDYDTPDLDSIKLDLIRIPATDPDRRQGSILLNPGGPGGSGVDFALGFGPFVGLVLGPDIPAEFDIVGFDPRGISRSTPIRCFNTLDDAFSILPPVAFPLTSEEVDAFQHSDEALRDACRGRGHVRRIGRHMSTANVARDMDVIRASMGDPQLNYLGLSYGTYLGTTYANLFPDRVRSVVVDGVLDPIAWVNDTNDVPFSTRLRSDEGAAATLAELFRQCEAAQAGNCALAPDAAARFDAVATSLRAAPLVIEDPETGEIIDVIRYQDLIGFVLGSLYDPFGYADIAFVVADLEADLAGSPSATAAATAQAVLARPPYNNFVEGFPAVACSETKSPSSSRAYEVFRAAGDAAEAEFGYFGQIWTWISSPCARWPFRDKDRYVGPFDAVTAEPVLVVGNLYDPATRYQGAQALRSILPNSGLLTVDVPGHTSLGLSACAGAVVGQYLLDPSVAGIVDGLVCPSEYNAFDLVAVPPAPTSQDSAPDVDAPIDLKAMAALRDAVGDQIGFAPRGVQRGGR